MRRTKIVATMGPATAELSVLVDLIEAGMNVARLNFSHGSHESHQRQFELIRQASAQTRSPVAILADLQGPKMRVGELEGGSVMLEAGARVTIVPTEEVGQGDIIPTTYEQFCADVNAGDRVLLADGEMELRVESVSGDGAVCTVIHGGKLGQHQGINLPGVDISEPALTEKDREDLAFALDLGVDYVALSFVRRPEDVVDIKRAISGHGRQVPVVAKIEKPEAIDSLDRILRATDVLMIARGDLGVEMPLERVPVLQKRIIAQAHRRSVPVITATQMLQSMVDNPRPTRAEASDVANAIFDETDAIMLSAETAVGEFPVEVVRTMDRIARTAETSQLQMQPFHDVLTYSVAAHANTIAHAACQAAHDLKARGLVVFSRSGSTACLTSMYRPRQAVIGVASNESTWRRMAMYWGVTPCLVEGLRRGEDMVPLTEQAAALIPGCRPGDTVVMTSGGAMPEESVTNSLRIQTVEVSGPPLGEGEEPDEAVEGTAPVSIDRVSCIVCGACVTACSRGVLEIEGDSARVAEGHESWCDRSGECEQVCPTGAIQVRRPS
ncbi:MAG: pyruvate kinase [Armatimonadia bacterium]|nr:pyruvate kinase [Armatimonadia bacterium]